MKINFIYHKVCSLKCEFFNLLTLLWIFANRMIYFFINNGNEANLYHNFSIFLSLACKLIFSKIGWNKHYFQIAPYDSLITLKYWVFGLCEREYSRLPNKKHHSLFFFVFPPCKPLFESKYSLLTKFICMLIHVRLFTCMFIWKCCLLRSLE